MKLLKGIRWFFRLFNIKYTYEKQKEKFARTGYFWKIFALISYLLFIALATACVWATVWLVKQLSAESLGDLFVTNWLYIFGMFFTVGVGGPLIFHNFATLIQNAIIAFASVKAKKHEVEFERIADKYSANIQAEQEVEQNGQVEEIEQNEQIADESNTDIQTADEQVSEPQIVETVVYGDDKAQKEEKKNKRKTAKGFDIAYGVICLVFIVLQIGSAVAMFFI